MHSLRELRATGGIEAFWRLNLLKGALTLADFVVTVSPTHATDLTSELGGFGLHDAFRALGDRLVGIANGIDQRLWNPVNDPFIAAPFSAADLSGKAVCKAALQVEYGLHEDADIPIFANSALASSRVAKSSLFQRSINLAMDSPSSVRITAFRPLESENADV